ncbi:hypothetical protein HPB48_027128 [Haemaphysalis longicornis]|uniref:Uncharacterized protein n=1 Tax=Haemaphysalis longicornis TaxID=44386 RepID=A0A9J6HDL0_HAELO|nr:hypothetical protein HPB48_027128 [Haemaphysalis longicornis]
MTQACRLALSRDYQFGTKWEQAVVRCFNHVPDIEQIARFLKAAPAAECKTSLIHLASIAMMIGGREQRRVTFPLSALCQILSETRLVSLKEDAPPVFSEKSAKELDFSGKGAFAAYQKLMTSGAKFTLNLSNESLSEQALFHMMFGTYVEDFGILSTITVKSIWNKREDFNAVFTTLKAAAPKLDSPASHPALGLKYYSKMAGATLVKFAARTTSATNAAPMFSGMRIRKFTKRMKEVCANSGEAPTSVTSLKKAEMALSHYNTSLTQKTELKDFEAGTVEWVSMATLAGSIEDALPLGKVKVTGCLYWD